MRLANLLVIMLLGICIPTQSLASDNSFAFLFFNEKDERTLERVRGSDTISVASVGGEPITAFETSRHVVENFDTIIIRDACLSACAEILLRMTAMKGPVQFENDPLIGFHHNSLIFSGAVSSKQADLAEKCYAEQNSILVTLIANLDGHRDIAKAQAAVLGVESEAVTLNEDCGGDYHFPPRRYWFPNSAQLVDVYGIDHVGSVCADDLDCMLRKLGQLLEPGEQLAIGERYYLFENAEAGFVDMGPIPAI